MHISAKVILPEFPSESSPLLIKKFESDFVDTVHRIGDLNKKVLFQSFLLKGHNAGIRVAVSLISAICFYPTHIFNLFLIIKSQCKRTEGS